MNEIYKKNIEVLKKNHPEIEFQNNILIGEWSEPFRYSVGDQVWYLQSQYDYEIPINIWCDQFDQAFYLNVFMIYGFGEKGYLEELTRRYPNNHIIVYEPCEEIVQIQMCKHDMSDLFKNAKLHIVMGKKIRGLFENTLRRVVGYENLSVLLYAAIPNYCKLFESEYEEFLERIRDFVMREITTRNTFIQREKYRGRNFLYNLEHFWKESGVVELSDALRAINKKNCPAVLISAGPSLDKNIEDLKPYQDKVFIVCVDAAIRTAYKHNIRPDLIVTIDPEFKDPTIFANDYGRNTPMLTSLTADIKVISQNCARKFYTYEQEYYVDEIIKDTKGQLKGLNTGGSVANNAFSAIMEMGFHNIILIGQDLGYPDNRLHASDVFYDEKEIDLKLQSGYFYVESIDGGQVLTEGNMNLYRVWYENMIIDHPELNVIDATEGGALIHGTEIMTLKEALEAYCIEKSGIDKDIELARRLLTSDEQKLVEERVRQTYVRMREIQEKLIQQKTVYEELDSLNRKMKYSSNSFKKCIKEIGEFHEFMETDVDVDIIRIFTKKGEYDAADQLSSKTESTYDEIKLVVDTGNALIEAYLEGINKLMQEWKEIRELEETDHVE